MIRNRYNQVPRPTQEIIWESDKTQENITYKRAKRSALYQQVTTMLQKIQDSMTDKDEAQITFKRHKATYHPMKYDIINDVKHIPIYHRKYSHKFLTSNQV